MYVRVSLRTSAQSGSLSAAGAACRPVVTADELELLMPDRAGQKMTLGAKIVFVCLLSRAPSSSTVCGQAWLTLGEAVPVVTRECVSECSIIVCE